MTSKERMLCAMRNDQPDCVPVAPDISNMIPAKLTGKPFWDIYLYRNPALWEAYINAVKYFGFDGWLPVYSGGLDFAGENDYIVFESEENIITRRMEKTNGKEFWSPNIMVYYRGNPPAYVSAAKLNLPDAHTDYKAIPEELRPAFEDCIEIYNKAKDMMGDAGVVGLSAWIPMIGTDEQVYRYYDRDEALFGELSYIAEQGILQAEQYLEIKPDFLFMGYSGGLTLQTPAMFREIALPCVKKIAEMSKKANIVSQMHSCGRSRELVKILAEETDTSNINPLEVPPMGDCDLAEIKKSFGSKISLMGNLHTTEVMLHGSAELVGEKSKEAIDAAGADGGFILSTGDQCGRDTPHENIIAMINTARTYGKY